MKKIDKILNMFDEVLRTDISTEDAIFVVANSFYTSKDEKINRDTLFRYIKSQIDMEKFHIALQKRDFSEINPERYSDIKNTAIINYKENFRNDKEIFSKNKIVENNNKNSEKIDFKILLNEINSLKEKLDYFNKINGEKLGILTIPKDSFDISEESIKRVTFRIEEKILEELEEFFKNHKEYSKTLIINFMIKEFLDNYKK